PVPFHVIFNPQIVLDPGEPAVFAEGCLSVAGFVARVPRANVVRVTELDETAQPVNIVARGWYARILQHEIDHLDGTLYIDRMDTRSFTSMENLTEYWKGKPVSEIKRALDLEAE